MKVIADPTAEFALTAAANKLTQVSGV